MGAGCGTKLTFSKIDSVIDCWSEKVPEEETWVSAWFRASMSCCRLTAVKAFRHVGVGVTPTGQLAAVAMGLEVLMMAPDPPWPMTLTRAGVTAVANPMIMVSAP